jgi:hypothetical protein
VRPVKIAAKPATRVHNFLVFLLKLYDACKYFIGMVAAKLVDTIFLHFHFFFGLVKTYNKYYWLVPFEKVAGGKLILFFG